jgi:hypothetical protein
VGAGGKNHEGANSETGGDGSPDFTHEDFLSEDLDTTAFAAFL